MDKSYPILMGCNYDDVICPICGNRLYHQEDYNAPWDACVISESCDEGGGTTGYLAICHNKFRKV